MMATINKPSQPLTPAADLEEVEGLIDEAIAADTSHAPLVENLVPAENLPSYVDDVLEFKSLDDFPIGEYGKIYIALDTNYIYRWEGRDYVQIGGGDNDPIINHSISITCHLEEDEIVAGLKEFVIDQFSCDDLPANEWFEEDPVGLVICNVRCPLNPPEDFPDYSDSFIIYKSDNGWVSLHHQWNLELEKNKLFVYCNASGLQNSELEYYKITPDGDHDAYMLMYGCGESVVPVPSSGSGGGNLPDPADAAVGMVLGVVADSETGVNFLDFKPIPSVYYLSYSITDIGTLIGTLDQDCLGELASMTAQVDPTVLKQITFIDTAGNKIWNVKLDKSNDKLQFDTNILGIEYHLEFKSVSEPK